MKDDFHKDLQFIKDEANRQDRHSWMVTIRHLIHHTALVSDMCIDHYLSKHSITHHGIAILTAIARNGGSMPQKSLAKKLNRTKQSIACSLANLEKCNYIRKESARQDKRKMIVTITEEGLKIAKECLPLRDQFYNSLAPVISTEEGQQLNDILNKLCDKMISDMKKSKHRK
jgi:DNA-binding MarR family transcriptional regulator